MNVVDRAAVSNLWNEYLWGDYTEDFPTIAEKVRLAVRTNPKLLKPVEYSQDVEATCPWCVEDPAFTIADAREIYQLLGYV